MPQGQHAELSIAAAVGDLATTRQVSTRTTARGLRALPPKALRLDLGGDWHFAAGRRPDPKAPEWRDAPTTRVPGHVAFDGLIPDHGVATLRRTIEILANWTGDAVFARFDGAYGQAEVFVNGKPAGTHAAGATSFDVDLSPFLASGENVLTIVLTEYTPHAVLDYMSWYAHISLLGIWREAFLFRVSKVHLGPTDLRPDWDRHERNGTATCSKLIYFQNDKAKSDAAIAASDKTLLDPAIIKAMQDDLHDQYLKHVPVLPLASPPPAP